MRATLNSAQREWCWPFFHLWKKWQDTTSGNVIRTHDQKIIGEFVVQERRCGRCNAVQIRKREW